MNLNHLLAYDFEVNSQNITQNSVFFALKGQKVDGHNYIDEALSKGAKFAIAEHYPAKNDKVIIVPSVYNTMRELAIHNMQLAKTATSICITGSVGKTTSKELIAFLLNQFCEHIYTSKKNHNSQIGLPICAAAMPQNTNYAVFEMGMTEFGNIQNLTKIVAPNISVITSICETHLASFNSIFDIAKAKSEILETRDQLAIILPADSPYKEFLKQKAQHYGAKQILSFGYSKESDAQIVSLENSEFQTIVNAIILGEKIQYTIKCNNISVAINSIAAILAVYYATHIPLKKLADCLINFSSPNSRGEIIHLKNILLIDDSYNACHTSMKSALHSLAKHSSRRKIAIIGDMLELGKNCVQYHEELAATIGKYDIDKVFACGNLSKKLFENISQKRQGIWCESSSILADCILDYIQPNDCIMIKGSNSMRMKNIVEKIKILM